MSDPSQPIDFSKEAEEIGFKIPGSDFGQQDAEDLIREWGKSIAARVEESTIQRCEEEVSWGNNPDMIVRLYASKAEEGK